MKLICSPKNFILKLATLFVFFFSTFTNTEAQQSIYVAIQGNDDSPGTLDRPLRTIEKSLSFAKSLPGQQHVTIVLRGGTYRFAKSVKLSKANWDSSKSITFTAYNGESVIFSGASSFNPSHLISGNSNSPNSGLSPNILAANLNSENLHISEWFHPYGFGHPVSPAPVQLFVNGKSYSLAKSPTSGKFLIRDIVSPGSSGSPKGSFQSASFTYDESVSFTSSDTTVTPLWVSGVFNKGWCDEFLPARILSDKTIQLLAPSTYDVESSIPSTTNHDRDKMSLRGFAFSNSLNALTVPNLYVVDTLNSTLYFWPSNTGQASTVEVTTLTDPFFDFSGVSNISFTNLTFQKSRGSAISARSCRNISITKVEFADIGNTSIVTRDCQSFAISNCRFADIGANGIILDGGDRKSLNTSNNSIQNCEFTRIGTLYKTYTPPVKLSGVGALVTHCSFHDIGGQAIIFQGNDHIISDNKFTRVCTDYSDIGAVYTARDLTSSGTIIVHNIFDSIQCDPDLLVTAVYLDDGSSGIIIKNNLFFSCGTSGSESSSHGFGAVHVNGGTDNQILNNVFVNCRFGVSGDVMKPDQWAKLIATNKQTEETNQNQPNLLSSAFVSRYNHLKGINDANQPRTNHITNSITINAQNPIVSKSNTVSNLDIRSESSISSNSTLEEVTKYLDSHQSDSKTKGWSDWQPFDAKKIGVQ